MRKLASLLARPRWRAPRRGIFLRALWPHWRTLAAASSRSSGLVRGELASPRPPPATRLMRYFTIFTAHNNPTHGRRSSPCTTPAQTPLREPQPLLSRISLVFRCTVSDVATRARKLFAPQNGTPMPRPRRLSRRPDVPLTHPSWEIISGAASNQSDRCLVDPYRPNLSWSRRVAQTTPVKLHVLILSYISYGACPHLTARRES